jgi:hypothetical protein
MTLSVYNNAVWAVKVIQHRRIETIMNFELVRLQEGCSRSLFQGFFLGFAEKVGGKTRKASV